MSHFHGDASQDDASKPVLAAQASRITAEDLIIEARETKKTRLLQKHHEVRDLEELKAFQRLKRTEFEEALRRKRLDLRQWLRYAEFEISQKEWLRARSIHERSLEVDPSSVMLWMRYAQAELANKNVNHARNVLVRATHALPMVHKLWLFRIQLERKESDDEARKVFEEWLLSDDDEVVFRTYISFETQRSHPKATAVFGRLVSASPTPKNWLDWAQFEDRSTSRAFARKVYERAINSATTENSLDPEFVGVMRAWIAYEARCLQAERALALVKFALKALPPQNRQPIYEALLNLKKIEGDGSVITSTLDELLISKYKAKVEESPLDVDSWWSLLDLVAPWQSKTNIAEARSLFESSVLHAPESEHKDDWRRYVYLYIRWAVYEETIANDIQGAKRVYELALDRIPHDKFSFAKLWLLAANLEIRAGDLDSARKLLGRAIGLSGKPRIFKGYIALEVKLREMDRCRRLYSKFIEKHPLRVEAWLDFIALEEELGEVDRVQGLYELAVSLNISRELWTSYIDFEMERGEMAKVDNIFHRMALTSMSAQVWLDYALFCLENYGGIASARKALDLGEDALSSDDGELSTFRSGRADFEEKNNIPTNDFGSSSGSQSEEEPEKIAESEPQDKMQALLANAMQWAKESA